MRILIVTAAAALAACTPSAPIADNGAAPVTANAGTVVLTGARGFAAAELVYTTAAKAAILAVDAGVIKGADAAWLREKNARARDLLIKGKSATDSATKAAAAAELFDIAARLDTLTQKVRP